jgi:mono/diheme cytochrome c family protein
MSANKKRWLMAAVMLGILATPLVAGVCRVRVRGSRFHDAAVVLEQVYPATYYSVGAALQEEAIAERIAQRVLVILSENSGGGIASGIGGTAAATDGRQDAIAAAAPDSLVQARCAKCHASADHPSGLSLADVEALTCEQRLSAIRAVLSGKMPKGGATLSPDEAGLILMKAFVALALAIGLVVFGAAAGNASACPVAVRSANGVEIVDLDGHCSSAAVVAVVPSAVFSRSVVVVPQVIHEQAIRVLAVPEVRAVRAFSFVRQRGFAVRGIRLLDFVPRARRATTVFSFSRTVVR